MTVQPNEKFSNVPSSQPESPIVLVLLGASNLSRGCYALSKFIKKTLSPRPVEVLIASGPGRGYHAFGGLLNINYQPIRSSNIFEVAQQRAESGCRIVALVTDMGNDIMYNVSAEQLAATIQQIFDRLHSMKAEVFYTTLPVAFEKGVSPVWFYILRSLLLPFSRVNYDTATTEIIAFNQFLRNSTAEHRHLISDMDRYFGFDEIHYGWFRAHSAWTHIAGLILDTLGVETNKKISLAKMLQSYVQEFRQVIGTDMLGLNNKNQEHF